MARKNVIKKYSPAFGIALMLLLMIGSFYAQDRFPRPEFESGYQRPLTTTPGPQARFFEVFDIFVLIAALGVASYLAFKKRSRSGIFWMTVFSAAYFGFFRNGCVCAIGSLQNVSAAVFYPGYFIPLSVIAFFVIPLIFALFFGRTFCSSVCPLGCIQDLVLLKAVKVPRWLSEILGVVPYIYLALAVLFAATGSAFIICRYDPFISIYRMTGDFNTLLYSFGFVGLSVFVGRPYCRFLCPYGVLLGWMSGLSKHHVTTTPNNCVLCRLCEDACPFDHIDKPASGKIGIAHSTNLKRIATVIVLIPLISTAAGWALSETHLIFSRMHPTVRLAEEVLLEDAGGRRTTSLETRTFRSKDKTKQELIDQAREIQNQFCLGGWFAGGFLGLLFSIKIIKFSIVRPRADYEINKISCYSCARCFESCPNEHVRLGNLNSEPVLDIKQITP